MVDAKITKDCPYCVAGIMYSHTHDGIGNTTHDEEECTRCNGTGKLVNQWLDVSDIMDKLNDIKEKVDEIKAAQ